MANSEKDFLSHQRDNNSDSPNRPFLKSEAVSENVEELLKNAKSELKKIQEEEKTGRRRTAHLIGSGGSREVNLDNLTETDLQMWLRRDYLTKRDLELYRESIGGDEVDRLAFAAFLINIVSARLLAEELKKFDEQ